MTQVYLILRIILGGMSAQLPEVHEFHGYAGHYSEGLMSRVAANRGLRPSSCMIASSLAYGPDLGMYANVESKLNGKVFKCKIVDVSADENTTGRGTKTDRQRHLDREMYAELDFESAKVLCEIDYVSQEPPEACPVIVRVWGW